MAKKPANDDSAAPTLKQDGERQFDLKPIEMQMLNTIQEGYMNSISNFLSFIGLERLGYTVTPFTTYRVEGNHLFITEKQPPSADDAVATGDSATSEAMK